MFYVKNKEERGRNYWLFYFTSICLDKQKESDKSSVKIVSLRVTGSASGNFRIKNGSARLRLRAVYVTVLSSRRKVVKLKKKGTHQK